MHGTCLQISVFPEMPQSYDCFPVLKNLLKQLVFGGRCHVTCSCPVIVLHSCSLCSFDLLKMSFFMVLIKMKLKLGGGQGEFRAEPSVVLEAPVMEWQCWPGNLWRGSPRRGQSGLSHSRAAGLECVLPVICPACGNTVRGTSEVTLCPSVDNGPAAHFLHFSHLLIS